MRSSITAALLRKRFRGGAGNGLSISAPASLTFDDADQPISLYDYEAHNLLANSDLNGAVAGTPGTAPTGWITPDNGGTLGTITDDGSGNYVLPLTVTAARHYFSDDVTLVAGSIYHFTFTINKTAGTLAYNQIVALSAFSDLDANYTRYLDDGVAVSSGANVPDGTSEITIQFKPLTDGVGSLRMGIGTSSGPQTATISFTKPFLHYASAPSDYVKTTGTAGTPVASYGRISFADSEWSSGSNSYRLQISCGSSGTITFNSALYAFFTENAGGNGTGTIDITGLLVPHFDWLFLDPAPQLDNYSDETVSLTGTFTHVATGRSRSFSISVTSNAASGFTPSLNFSDARNSQYIPAII